MRTSKLSSSLSNLQRARLGLALVAAVAAAACGGTVAVDPIGASGSPADEKTPSDTGGAVTPTPKAPVGPYTGLVHTTDVSILYPLPTSGGSGSMLAPTAEDAFGPLLPSSAFDTVMGARALDRTTTTPPSGYPQLGVVSLRIDPCSARKGAGTCTSEVRLVFQALYDKTSSSPDGDPSVGTAATDGALHVAYDVPEAELVVMMKQILTLKAAAGDLASQILEPHPILVKQGLEGTFATGLRAIVLEHLGGNRIARITSFDHNMDPDSDGWNFEVFDSVGGTLTRKDVPKLGRQAQLIAGSEAFAPTIGDTFVFEAPTGNDQVGALVNSSRPAPGAAGAQSALQPAFDASLRIQNPTLHNAETTDCGNCHLAEGAKLVGASVFSLTSTAAFTHPTRNLGYRSDRTSVTNFHAFGYLHRRVSIMQRTANESALVADAMEQKVK